MFKSMTYQNSANSELNSALRKNGILNFNISSGASKGFFIENYGKIEIFKLMGGGVGAGVILKRLLIS